MCNICPVRYKVCQLFEQNHECPFVFSNILRRFFLYRNTIGLKHFNFVNNFDVNSVEVKLYKSNENVSLLDTYTSTYTLIYTCSISFVTFDYSCAISFVIKCIKYSNRVTNVRLFLVVQVPFFE